MFPRNADDVSAIVKLAKEYNVPMVGRGAGTGLSGGAIPRDGGIMIAFARMNRILEIDLENERAVLRARGRESRHHARRTGIEVLLRA